MQPTRRPHFKPKDQILKIGDIEDELEERLDLDERPPCRQNPNLFDLEDNFHPVLFIQKFNGFIQESGRPCRIDHRPPSRHKTPPKALGLELPPKKISSEFLNADLAQCESNSSFGTDSFSNTMPINFGEGEKKWKNLVGKEDNPRSKIRIKPKTAKSGKSNEKANIRIWSATGKNNKKGMDVPIIVSKGERVSMSFSSSRREKAKMEIEKKSELAEEKRKEYFKKGPEKRASSSSNKGKISMIVPFKTNLEPEFLKLFAKGEDFNF